MIFGSICSGIEAASVAWHPLGWRAAFLSEIEAFPRAVLTHHYPETPLHGDFTTIEAGEYEPVDLLVGGTPCQSFSIAGLRGGLADERGNLALEYLRLAQRLRPRWLVWENVPGVLSSVSHIAPDLRAPDIDLDAGHGPADGEEVVVDDQYEADESHAVACFLAGLSELGYGWAYGTLDAQYTGVPQRRRRVLAIGYLGDWRRAAAVLFERHSLSGHPAPRRETRKDLAPTLSARPSGGGGLGTDFDLDGGIVHCPDIVPQAISSKWAKGSSGPSGDEIANLVSVKAFSIMPMNSGKDFKGRETDIAQPVMAAGPAGGNQGGDYIVQPIAFALRGREGGAVPEVEGNGNRIGALCAASGGSSRDYVALSAVRRLTPRECERLQGFPDDYTAIPYRKGVAADGPRYKALGNTMAVPVMAWIGKRIAAVDAMEVV